MKRRSTFLAMATAAAVAVTIGVLGGTSAQAAASGPITGLGGKCVDVASASSANGTHVQLYDCNGTSAQSWTVGNSDNTVRALGKCLDVASGSTASGAKVQLYDCNGTAAQQWTPSNGELVNVGSGKCLDATDKSSANGNQLQIWTCTGTSNQLWTLPTGTTPPGGGLNTSVAPGGNFNLSVWELQEPVGSPGSPTTISSSRLQGAGGYQDSYFSTDGSDGAMTFWAPEKGVTTPNSNYARSELREMNTNGSAADWSLAGTHRLTATLRVVSVTSNVCVGQIHLGSGGSSTKPLIELYYHSNGDIVAGTENSPDGGQTTHTVGHVSVGTKWSYTIGVSGGDTIDLTVNGSTTHYAIPSSFNPYKQYFKAGSYNQSSSDSTTNGARVAFYALSVSHS
ncbi:polysaccharide lyase family 7 protein [Actinacidiphila sp. ITFR-21]|uniref:polysaccharide lyase family 7 protein n=1 Tax=Actinacidiphila sp. ITFR-21 TaxID=3075199 RepID=UPI00288B96B4|nr:polysaccharide lyase family 7 protein [Streptomyces sp. ITFR-21]WNI16435.1 polysaccharide lyase family 7 protein [Streptomyces sp. ITFR-21]